MPSRISRALLSVRAIGWYWFLFISSSRICNWHTGWPLWLVSSYAAIDGRWAAHIIYIFQSLSSMALLPAICLYLISYRVRDFEPAWADTLRAGLATFISRHFIFISTLFITPPHALYFYSRNASPPPERHWLLSLSARLPIVTRNSYGCLLATIRTFKIHCWLHRYYVIYIDTTYRRRRKRHKGPARIPLLITITFIADYIDIDTTSNIIGS